jgi:hypothetical protein
MALFEAVRELFKAAARHEDALVALGSFFIFLLSVVWGLDFWLALFALALVLGSYQFRRVSRAKHLERLAQIKVDQTVASRSVATKPAKGSTGKRERDGGT